MSDEPPPILWAEDDRRLTQGWKSQELDLAHPTKGALDSGESTRSLGSYFFIQIILKILRNKLNVTKL